MSNKLSNYNLFLDDFRSPQDAFLFTKNTLFLKLDWVIVRSYNEFVECIETRGIPCVISFDHDLSEEHYNPDIKPEDYKEKTGYECAKFLVDKIMDLNIAEFPQYLLHSMNDSGRKNIDSYFKSYLKSLTL